MSELRFVTRSEEPAWPPEESFGSGSERALIGGFWVDWIGERPSEADVALRLAPPSRRLPTYRIVRRLEEAGLLPAASALLDSNLAFRWRFTTAADVATDDVDLVAGLTAIGADVTAILAPE